jgi:prevent-host-death family protein
MSQDTWQLQEAKNRFGEVVKKALAEIPQTVTRHDQEIIVVLSKTEYNHLLKSQTRMEIHACDTQHYPFREGRHPLTQSLGVIKDLLFIIVL